MRDTLSRFDPREIRRSELVPDRIRRSYLLKFTAIVAVIALVTVAIGLFFQSSVAASLTEDQENNIAGIAEDQATSIESWADRNRESTRLISTRETFANGSSQEVSTALSTELLGLSEEHEAIHYVDTASGEIIESSDSTAAGDTLEGRGYEWLVTGDRRNLTFRDSDDVVISEITVVEGDGQIAFASPVAGNPDRAIVIPVNVAVLSQEFRNPIEGSNTQVVSAAGTVQVDDNTETLGDEYQWESVLQRGLHGDIGTTTEDNLVIGHAPVRGVDQPNSTADVGWVVLVHVPESNAFALQSAISRNILIIIAVGLFGFVLVGATIGRNTVSALNDLSDRAERLRDGKLDTTVTTGRVDEIGRLYDSFGEMRDSLDARITEARESEGEATEAKQEAEKAREEAESARADAEQFTEQLQQTAAEYSTGMNRAADGDLTQRLASDGNSDAMREIAEAFNEMLDRFEETIVELQAFAGDVSVSSEEVTTTTAEITEASADVSESIQQIANGADEQTEQIQTMMQEMNQLSASVEEIASQASEVAENSRQTIESGRSGRESAGEAIDRMTEIEDLTEQTVQAVEQLESRFDEISEVVELITTIADETNMLALNASIEAARAGGTGGDGDGFAVVADEVKGLAEETKASGEEVESLIAAVREQMDRTVEDVQQTQTRIDDGTSTVDEAVTAFESVLDSIQQTNDGIQEISDVTDNQARSTQQTVSMMEDVADISRETSNRTESVSAAAQQQAASLDEVRQNVKQLETQATDLENRLEQFKVNSETQRDNAE